MENSQQQSNYLITEPIRNLLLKFAIPCVISLMISCLYNIVDQIFIGNGIGYLGNAATGIIFPLTVIGWGIALMFGDGAAAALSLAQGRGEKEQSGKIVANSILLSFVCGLALAVVCLLWGGNLLYSLGATDATIRLTSDYGNIIFVMLPFALVQCTLSSIIRADGNPRFAMLSMLAGAVLNIIFDPITIFVWGWGIQGAAYATIFGQFISFLICVIYLLRNSKTFKLKISDFKPNLQNIRSILPLGSSSFLTQISIVLVTIVDNKLLVAYGARSEYGADIPLAAFVVIMKLFQIVLTISIGIASGAQPIIGFNYGAKRIDRVKEALKYILLWTFAVSAVATILFEAMPIVFINIFGAESALYLSFAQNCLQIYLSLLIFTCLQKVCAIFLQSIGKTAAAISLAVIRDVVFLIAFSFIIPAYIGVEGIFWAAPAADILALGVTAIVLLRVWKQFGSTKAKNAEISDTAMLKSSRKGVIVTIARQHGSAGKYIGQLIAEKLAIPFYYKEVVALAAQESGLAKEFISDININSPSLIHEMYLSTTEVVRQAIIAQEKIIRKIADNGSCVIVGRAADYVLRNYEDVVRIFIHAPETYRVKKVMEIYGDTEQEGKHSIARSDAARAAYYKTISGVEWGTARQYELHIDSSSIGVENTANVICDYLLCYNQGS
ncbi:MAG: MATE family efflux transporter [Clostridiales bacterium]|jgi:putative MATE family efflux protein|nr:MATE family efflux transporter [Clostridiales bacterium]